MGTKWELLLAKNNYVNSVAADWPTAAVPG